MNFHIKKIVFALLCTLQAVTSLAQFNYYKFSGGASVGTTYLAANADPDFGFGYKVNGDFYFTPFISAGLEVQLGQIKGLSGNTYFNNEFQFFNWNNKLYVGQFYKSYNKTNQLTYLLRNFYVGVGMGIISNNITPADTTIFRQPKNKTILFPLNCGFDYNFKDYNEIERWGFNINVQYNLAMDGYMDGDIVTYSSFKDMYFLYTAGINYKFGSVGLDRRKRKIR